MACQAPSLRSPLGMRTPESHGTCHESLLCWFLEAPGAMKFAWSCTYFLRRLTLWIHYHSKLPAKQACWAIKNGRTARQKYQRKGRREQDSRMGWYSETARVWGRCENWCKNLLKQWIIGAIKAERWVIMDIQWMSTIHHQRNQNTLCRSAHINSGNGEENTH